MSAIAICVNPMSGRDVRRLAAKAPDITPRAKQDMVARIAIGADATGIQDIYMTEEPFRIASQGTARLRLSAKIHLLRTSLTHTAKDTEAAIVAFLKAGVSTIVSLGGDGTNRAIVRCLLEKNALDVNLIPVSAGTNNAFPALAEPTTTGMVAALAAQGRLTGCQQRCKVLHLSFADGSTDVGLIDAAILSGDAVGNLLPFETSKLSKLMLTQSNPAVVGMAAIGGLLEVVTSADDHGLLLELDGNGNGQTIWAPVSPGLFDQVTVASFKQVPLNQTISLAGDGVLALDGDRDHALHTNAPASITIRRDGPWVFNTNTAIQQAIRMGGVCGGASGLIQS